MTPQSIDQNNWGKDAAADSRLGKMHRKDARMHLDENL